jgi:uncharacterized protein DUF4236
MGWRFHKSVKIAPGVRLNLSKRGPGLSFGGRGMRYSVGPGGRRTTVGIPGTGLSYVKQTGTRRGQGCSCCLGLATLPLGVALAAALTVRHVRRDLSTRRVASRQAPCLPLSLRAQRRVSAPQRDSSLRSE